MNSLSIFGTSSDAGKSTLAFALTYLLHHRGIKVAPFKAQNVSNNSRVCDDGGEIAIPQHFAAEAIGIKTSHAMNPILIKSGAKNSAHLVINGVSVGEKDVHEYYRDINRLKPIVKKAFKKLQKEYECIVAEGAGSPVELNLMEKDLSNIYIAQKFNTKIILVADIERGGVFASIFGVYALLPKELKKNVIGVIVNKFRGDKSLFDDGVQIIEERFGIPVFGVLDYEPFNLAFEDSASLLHYSQDISHAIIKVGVIHFPHMSNYNDVEPLVADKEIDLRFITTPSEAHSCDVLILPGSKRVIEDLAWLRERGFEPLILEKKRFIVAICGGYEMLHENILDPWHVESDKESVRGLARLKGDVIFQKEKIVKKGEYRLFDSMAKGYEIHNGVTKKRAVRKKKLYGTFIHGIFEDDAFREALFSKIDSGYEGYSFKRYKESAIEKFTSFVAKNVAIDTIVQKLKEDV